MRGPASSGFPTRYRSATLAALFIGPAYPESVRGDGDGWVVSDTGSPHWGRFGAAGLLLRAPRPDGSPAVLLQHRAPWSHQGGTWGLPGGARDSHESPEEAAVREAHEEAGLPGQFVSVRASVITDQSESARSTSIRTRWTSYRCTPGLRPVGSGCAPPPRFCRCAMTISCGTTCRARSK